MSEGGQESGGRGRLVFEEQEEARADSVLRHLLLLTPLTIALRFVFGAG